MKFCPEAATMCFDVVPFKDSDKTAVMRFFEKTFPHMKHARSFWIDSVRDNTTLILKDERQVRGLLTTSIRGKDLWINLIGVDPPLQGKKVGSHLLNIACDRARDSGLSELHLDTELVKPENLSFYLSHGWEIIDLDPSGYAHSPSVHFAKRIKK